MLRRRAAACRRRCSRGTRTRENTREPARTRTPPPLSPAALRRAGRTTRAVAPLFTSDGCLCAVGAINAAMPVRCAAMHAAAIVPVPTVHGPRPQSIRYDTHPSLAKMGALVRCGGSRARVRCRPAPLGIRPRRPRRQRRRKRLPRARQQRARESERPARRPPLATTRAPWTAGGRGRGHKSEAVKERVVSTARGGGQCKRAAQRSWYCNGRAAACEGGASKEGGIGRAVTSICTPTNSTVLPVESRSGDTWIWWERAKQSARCGMSGQMQQPAKEQSQACSRSEHGHERASALCERGCRSGHKLKSNKCDT